MIIPSLGSLENHTQDGQWKMSGQKYCFVLSNPWRTRHFFLSCMLAIEKLNSEHQILKILRLDIIGVFGEKNRKRKILLDHASVSCNLLLSYL